MASSTTFIYKYPKQKKRFSSLAAKYDNIKALRFSTLFIISTSCTFYSWLLQFLFFLMYSLLYSQPMLLECGILDIRSNRLTVLWCTTWRSSLILNTPHTLHSNHWAAVIPSVLSLWPSKINSATMSLKKAKRTLRKISTSFSMRGQTRSRYQTCWNGVFYVILTRHGISFKCSA